MAFELELEHLIEHIKDSGYLRSRRLEKALREVPRHLFIPEAITNLSYRDVPLSIGHGQTISQPSTVVIMTESLDVKEGQKILEIGTGSGWQTALLSRLVGKKGFVYSVERIHELVVLSKRNLKKVGIKNVKIFEGDGSLGLKKYSPYNRIIVTAACPEIPKPLIDQLKLAGRMVVPVGGYSTQEMLVVIKKRNEIEEKSIGSFAFVPLLGKYGFK